MLPIRIWARGRFYTDYYFPIFDGYIVGITNKDAAGFFEIDIACKDVLEVARFSSENINPALCVIGELKQTNAINLMSQPFYGHDHFDIVKKIFVGGKLEYLTGSRGGTVSGEAVESASAAANNLATSAAAAAGIAPIGLIVASKAVGKVANAEFQGVQLDALDKFEYLTNSDISTEDKIQVALESKGTIQSSNFTIDRMLAEVSKTVNLRKVIAWGNEITPYRIFNFATPDYWTSDFSSRLEILQMMAENTYYDFYVDGAGNVHYHPQMLDNLFITNDAAYIPAGEQNLYKHKDVWWAARVIGPEETLGNSPSINIEAMVTFLTIRGKDPNIENLPPILGNLYGTATHRENLARFGYRRELKDVPIFNYNVPLNPDPDNVCAAKVTLGDVMAIAMLQYSNAELYTTTTNIIFRPELDICRPVFFVEDNTVFYVNSITHNITIGGEATTTINCSFGRKDYETPTDLQSFILAQEGIWRNYTEQTVGIDVQEFAKNLPIDSWKSFLDDNQYKALLAAREFATMDLSKPDPPEEPPPLIPIQG
jgi:hypothetical protein